MRARQESCALGTIGSRQEFTDVGGLSVSDSACRHNCVYVVIGGDGGLGEVWTRHMRATARPVRGSKRRWTRSRRLAASDETALADAVQRIHAIFPRIDGVVHSALVLQDKSVLGHGRDCVPPGARRQGRPQREPGKGLPRLRSGFHASVCEYFVKIADWGYWGSRRHRH